MNNYVIVREDYCNIRAIAREAMRGQWGKILGITVLYLLLSQGIGWILAYFLPSFPPSSPFYETGFSFAEQLYVMLTSGAFTFGYIAYALAVFRRQPAGIAKLFEGFEGFVKVTIMTILIGIFTLLWSLLLFIPGIVAAFSYSQAYNIMHDHPEYSVMQCIRESKKLMYGNKMKLFVLFVSYIGWIILAAIPTGIITYIILSQAGETIREASVVTAFTTTILFVPIMAYMTMGFIVFYEMAKGNLVRKTIEVEPVNYANLSKTDDPIADMAIQVMKKEDAPAETEVEVKTETESKVETEIEAETEAKVEAETEAENENKE